MKSLYPRMISISILILFTLTCEDKVWDNPSDANTTLDPSEWAPKKLQAQELSDSEIKLTWIQDEKRIEGFRIERQEDGGSWEQVGEVASDVTQYIDIDLTVGLSYTYRVYAYATSNQSGYTTSNATSTDFPSPTNLTAAAQNDADILLEWTDNCGFEEGFRIERQDDSGSWTQIVEVAADVTHYTDIGLSIGSNYKYRVYAFTASNQSGYATSNETSTSFPGPSDLTATPQNDTDILLEWTDNCGFEEGFRIERQDDIGSWTQIVEVAADVTQYTDTGLDSNIIGYFYRIYAYTVNNVSDYSNIAIPSFIITDIDGNEYRVVRIGDQWWMAENLKATHYRNGDATPNITDNSDWDTLSTGAYCNYENDPNNAETYGRLYNWYAVNDSRNIAPEGWHVSTDDEWKQLEMYLGMSQSEADDTGWRGTDEGDKLKETGTDHWITNTGATNESGFTALPSSRRSSSGSFGSSSWANFWSSTEYNSSNAWFRYLKRDDPQVGRENSNKQSGFSVRCVRD